MIKHVFVNLISWMRDTRVEVKHSAEDIIDGIPKDVLALVLKIVINSIYGKLGFEAGSLYDRLAVLKVTINGQLLMLMLAEELELNNIHVISANTDGLMIKIYDNQWDVYNKITKEWEIKSIFSNIINRLIRYSKYWNFTCFLKFYRMNIIQCNS